MSDPAAVSSKISPPPLLARCPECDGEISLAEQPMICELLTCSQCAAELEVVGLDPFDLALAPEVEEDWGE